MFKTTLLVIASLALGCSTSNDVRRESAPTPAPTPEPTAAPSALQTAHDAYLAGDYLATAEAVRDVLLDPSSGALAKENALELLDSAYEATNGSLPSRLTLPAGFSRLALEAQRGISKYSLWRGVYLWMRVKEGLGAKVDELSLLAADGTVIAKKGLPSSRWTIKHVEPGFDDVVLNLDKVEALPADGVYTIRVGMEGKRVVDTWFIARHLEASTSPVLLAPGEQVTEPSPTVRFEPFRSPEHSSFERRSVGVFVDNPMTHEVQLNYWSASPERTEVHIDKRLVPGSYWVSVSAQERRSFGPIDIGRAAVSGASFSVVQ